MKISVHDGMESGKYTVPVTLKALRKRRLYAGGEPSSGSQRFSVTVQFFSTLQVMCDELGSSISLSLSLSLFP